MWGVLSLAILGLWVSVSLALAQPADCTTHPAPAPPSHQLSIKLKGQPGVRSGLSGKAFVALPMQAPQIECGEPSVPTDVLGGSPGDLLRGTPPRAAQ